VVISRTVKDLVAGSGIEFDDAGEHLLKGIEEKWQLFNYSRSRRLPDSLRARGTLSSKSTPLNRDS
jgi:hypothetical protein